MSRWEKQPGLPLIMWNAGSKPLALQQHWWGSKLTEPSLTLWKTFKKAGHLLLFLHAHMLIHVSWSTKADMTQDLKATILQSPPHMKKYWRYSGGIPQPFKQPNICFGELRLCNHLKLCLNCSHRLNPGLNYHGTYSSLRHLVGKRG